MKYLDLTFSTPEENLACDEALLDLCEQGLEDEILRVWEASRHFIVVGYGNKISSEVNLEACAAARVPVFRRCTGGGTVLQGPGCFNYALVLRLDEAGPLAGITETNRFVMERNRKALQPYLSEEIAVCGCTDLATANVKFCGNAQRRRRHFLLFHGSLLLNLDFELMARLLPMPSRQPDYRQNRSHRDFLRNIPLTSEATKQGLRTAWHATEPLKNAPHESIKRLAEGKYSTPAWNFKF